MERYVTYYYASNRIYQVKQVELTEEVNVFLSGLFLFWSSNLKTNIWTILAKLINDFHYQIFLLKVGFYFYQDKAGILERRKLREKLKCKDFDWYLKHVLPELTEPPRDAKYFGV